MGSSNTLDKPMASRMIAAKTVYTIGSSVVRVSQVRPSALQRGAFSECEYDSAWRRDLTAAVIGFVATDILGPSDRIRQVSIFEANEAHYSLGVRGELGNSEYAVAIDTGKLIIYSKDGVRSYCMTIIKESDILIQLDQYDYHS